MIRFIADSWWNYSVRGRWCFIWIFLKVHLTTAANCTVTRVCAIYCRRTFRDAAIFFTNKMFPRVLTWYGQNYCNYIGLRRRLCCYRPVAWKRRPRPAGHLYRTIKCYSNQLPSSSRQPHSVHSRHGSPHPAHIISPHHSHLLRSHHLSYITPSTFNSILSSVFLFLPDWLHGSWTCTELSGHWRSFCFSFLVFYILFLPIHVLRTDHTQLSESTSNSSISYRMVNVNVEQCEYLWGCKSQGPSGRASACFVWISDLSVVS